MQLFKQKLLFGYNILFDSQVLDFGFFTDKYEPSVYSTITIMT